MKLFFISIVTGFLLTLTLGVVMHFAWEILVTKITSDNWLYTLFGLFVGICIIVYPIEHYGWFK